MEKKKKKKRQGKHSKMANIDYMEKFATEFSKHDVLMYPADFLKKKVGDVQDARKYAFMQISEALSINDWKMAQRQSINFKQQCIQKMRRFVRLSVLRGGSGHEALEMAPEWLKKLNTAFDLLNKALKLESQNDGNDGQATRKRMNNFMWDLYDAVRDEVAVSNKPAEALHGHDAVQRYAKKNDLPFLMLYEIWNRLLQLSLHKMIEVRTSGDRPAAPYRPSQLEWRLINMALLYDLRIIVVHEDSFTNSTEVGAMIQLYMLMCEAQIKFGCLMKNQKNKDMPSVGCEVQSDGKNDPSTSCSSEERVKTDEDDLVWEVADLWKYVHAEYVKHGRIASLVLLQRRWHELRQLTRRRLLDAFVVRDLHPHPLLLAIGKRFPSVVTSPLPAWSKLVADGLVITDANLALQKQMEYSKDDFPPDASMKDVTTDLFDWSDDDLEIIEAEREVIDIASDSDSEANTNGGKIDAKLLDKAIDQLLKENIGKSAQKSDNQTIISEPTGIKLECASEKAPQNVPDKEKNTSISAVAADATDTTLPLNQLDPTKTKVRIIFEDDSDLEELDRMNSNKSMSDEDNETEERNESLSNINDKPERKNKNIESNIADKKNAINDSETGGDYNTGIINKNVFNIDTERDQRNASLVVNPNIANNTIEKCDNTFSTDKTDKLSQNDYKIKDTNKNVINKPTETIAGNRNSDFIQNTDQILCRGKKRSSLPNKFQTNDECKDATVKTEDNIVETVNSGKDREKVVKSTYSSDGCRLTERPNPSYNFDITLALKKTVVANFYKMIGSDILNIPSKQIAEIPENSNSLIKHTKEIYQYAPCNKQMSGSNKLRSVRNSVEDAVIIDSKLLMLSRVVLTPIEVNPVWHIRSRNGSINCRQFSTKKFSAAPIITSDMLPSCRRYYRPSPFGRINITGLNTRSTQQLAALPSDIRAIRQKLTRHLKLSKTYYSAEFWSDSRNLKQLDMCVPVKVIMERLASRIVKRVELADIDEVRRINRTILTAQVAPNNVTSTEAQMASGERKLSDASSSLANKFVSTVASTAPTVAPTKEELKMMIKNLVLPSIKALGTYPRQEPVTVTQKTNRSMLWRIDDKKLENDIRHVVKYLSIQEQSKKVISKTKYKKKIENNALQIITVPEEPLDAYAEWQRQKTCTHKYFNFTTPGTFGKIKNDKKHVDKPKLVKKAINKMTFAGNTNASVETVDLMCISDDEDNALVICEESKEDEANVSLDNVNDTLTAIDSLKRPNAEKESESYKRRKLSKEITGASNSKSSENTRNDCDLIVIDDDEPVRDQIISSKATQDASTVNLLTSVLGLKTNQNQPSNVVYVVSTGNTIDSRSSTIVTAYGISAVQPKSIGTQKLASADSTSLIPEIPTLLNSTLQSPQKTEANTRNLTSENTLSGFQTMLSLNTTSTSNHIPISVNSKLTNSDDFTSFSSTSSHHPRVNICKQPRKLVTYKPMLVFEQTPTSLKSALIGIEKSASLNSTLSNRNKLSPLNSQLLHNVGTVIADSNKPITTNVVTSPPSLTSLAPSVSTQSTVGENKNNVHIQDRIIYAAAEIKKPAASKVEPHIVIDATVKSDSSDEVPKTNVDNCVKIDMNELNRITIRTNPTSSNNGSSSGSNAQLQTTRIVCVTSLANNDNFHITTNYDKTSVICSESHVNQIIPNSQCASAKSEGIVKSPNLIKDKLKSEENKIDESHSSNSTQSLNAMPVISSVSSLAPRIRVKDEFKISNFDVTPQKCLSSDVTCDDCLPDSEEPESKLLICESFDIEEKDLSGEIEKQKVSRGSPVENKPALGSVAVKVKRITTEDENVSGIKTSVIVKNEQSGQTIKESRKKSNDSNDMCEEFANRNGPDTLLVRIVTSHEKWTAAYKVHSNQRTEDNTSVCFCSIADLGASAVPVSQYAAQVADPDEPLLKIDSTRPCWLLDNKYVLLTDERVQCHRAAYLTSLRVGSIAPYSVLLFPTPDGRALTLDMGAKKGRDVIVCGCQAGRDRCPLCESLARSEAESPPKWVPCASCGVTATRARTRLLQLRQRVYRKVSDRPLKYVNAEAHGECRGCLVGVKYVADPETVLINDKAYEKISGDPLMYSPVLSVVQNAQSCSELVKREAELYLLNLRTAQRRRLLYHADPKHQGFNKAVVSLMAKLDREETDSWYRLQIQRANTIE